MLLLGDKFISAAGAVFGVTADAEGAAFSGSRLVEIDDAAPRPPRPPRPALPSPPNLRSR